MKKVFIFLAGAALGSIVTYKITEKYFNNLIDEEVESVKETFKKRLVEDEGNKENTQISEEKPYEDDKIKLEEIVENNHYGIDMAADGVEDQQVESVIEQTEDESDYTVKVENGKEIVPPYVITEDEFGEFGNEEKTLMFFTDNKLVDEDEELIIDPESVIGDALLQFTGDPYIERVYVRDEHNEIDYIILKSEKSYEEVYGEED